jgi:hypothetical protein
VSTNQKTVPNVSISELLSHLAHVQIHIMKKKIPNLVKSVTKSVLGVLMILIIVELVWLTESMPQFVNVHQVSIKT